MEPQPWEGKGSSSLYVKLLSKGVSEVRSRALPAPRGGREGAAGHHAKHLRDSLGLLFYGEPIVVNFSTNT